MNNLFIATGRITKDLELRYTKDNKAVCEVSIAVNNGQDDTTFIKTTLFGKVAETTSKYCKKGDLIGISGIIKNHNYEDKEGNKRYEYSFLASKVTFLSTKKEEIKDNKVAETKNDPYKDFANEFPIDDSMLPF